MLDQILNSPEMNYMSRGMQASHMRHEVISNNIANINTPGFKRSELEFEDLLAKEIYGEEPSGKLQMVRTHDKHLPMKPKKFIATPQIELDSTTTMRVDKNNVDIDIEMASMAKNHIYYTALARQLGGHVNKLKNTISSK